jgi:hypothetical protein
MWTVTVESDDPLTSDCEASEYRGKARSKADARLRYNSHPLARQAR